MATVYSYIRFSSKRQEQGDSVRRQLDMQKDWLTRHPEHRLDTKLKLRDLGVSAFHGHNLDKEKGSLGAFIELATKPNSPIEKGSILLIESLDRFSRKETFEASTVLNTIVKAGLVVVLLSPERTIDQTNISELSTVLPITVEMSIAHEQSKQKRRRIREVWKAKRDKASDGTPMSKRCPSWLKPDKNGKAFTPIAPAVEAIKYIFARTIDGVGQRTLTAELNAKHRPIGRSKRWNGSYVQKVLSDRAVLGELQPYRFNDEGERQPVGMPIGNYYPRIIDDLTFDKAAVAKHGRRKAKGPNSRFINLFVGLLRCSDGHPMHIAKSTQRRKDGSLHIQRRLISYGYRERLKDSCPVSLSYDTAERLILNALAEIESRHVLEGHSSNDKAGEISDQIRAAELRIEKFQNVVSELNVEGLTASSLKPIIAQIESEELKRDELRRQLAVLAQKQQVREEATTEGLRDLLTAIAERPLDERNAARQKLRSLIASYIKEIIIEPYRNGSKVEARIEIIPIDGESRFAQIRPTTLKKSAKLLMHDNDGKLLCIVTPDGHIYFNSSYDWEANEYDISVARRPEDEKEIFSKPFSVELHHDAKKALAPKGRRGRGRTNRT